MGNCSGKNSKVRQCIEDFDIFPQSFSEAEKQLFSSFFDLIEVSEGTTIYKEGQPARECYFVVRGEVTINWGNKALCRCIDEDILGDESFIECAEGTDVERLTTAITETECVLLSLCKRNYHLMADTDGVKRIFGVFKERIMKQHNLIKYCLLRKIPFLNDITGDSFVELSSLFEYIHCPEKMVVCEEGSQGDHFYLLCRGTAVITTSKNHVEVVLSNLVAGAYFGEISLVKKIPRTANVKTLSECILMRLSEEEFARFVTNAPSVRDHLLDLIKNRTARTLRACKIPFFSTLSEPTFNLIAEVSKVITYLEGDIVFQAGQQGDNFYIICEGSVSLLGAIDGQEFKVLEKGDYFGELALMTDKPRSATVKCKETCLLLAIPKEEFRSIFADERSALAEIEIRVLREDVELYSVLNHPKGMEMFLEHQRKEFNVDNVEFWQAAEKFYRTYHHSADTEVTIPLDRSLDQLAAQYPVGDEASMVKLVSEIIKGGKANTVLAAKEMIARWERRTMALSIYNVFIKEESEKQQNISDSLRRMIAKTVVRNEFPHDLFRESQEQVYKMMQEPFHRFKKTEEFQDLLELCGSYRKSGGSALWNKAKLKLEDTGRISPPQTGASSSKILNLISLARGKKISPTPSPKGASENKGDSPTR